MDFDDLQQPFGEETEGDLQRRQATTKPRCGFYTECHHLHGECL